MYGYPFVSAVIVIVPPVWVEVNGYTTRGLVLIHAMVPRVLGVPSLKYRVVLGDVTMAA